MYSERVRVRFLKKKSTARAHEIDVTGTQEV